MQVLTPTVRLIIGGVSFYRHAHGGVLAGIEPPILVLLGEQFRLRGHITPPCTCSLSYSLYRKKTSKKTYLNTPEPYISCSVRRLLIFGQFYITQIVIWVQLHET